MMLYLFADNEKNNKICRIAARQDKQKILTLPILPRSDPAYPVKLFLYLKSLNR